MLSQIAFADPQTIGNPRDLTLASYEQIYTKTFVQGR
jgi:alcohol dehydrogenase class IV